MGMKGTIAKYLKWAAADAIRCTLGRIATSSTAAERWLYLAGVDHCQVMQWDAGPKGMSDIKMETDWKPKR